MRLKFSILMIVFCLIGCTNAVLNKDKETENINGNEGYKYYVIDNDVLNEVREYINSNEHLRSFVTRFDNEPLVEAYMNRLEITLTNKDVSNITVYQDNFGELKYELYFMYENGENYLIDQYNSANGTNTSIYVEDNGNYYYYVINSGDEFYSEEITDSAKSKINDIYQEYISLGYRETSYIDDLIDIVNKGKYFKLLELDEDVANRLNVFDKILPLKEYNDSEFRYYRYLNDVYVVERNDMYTIIDSSNKLLYSYQWEYPMIYNDDIVFINNNNPIKINNREYQINDSFNFYENNNILAYYEDNFVRINLEGYYMYKVCPVDISGINKGEVATFKFIDFDSQDKDDECFITYDFNVVKYGVVSSDGEIIYEYKPSGEVYSYNDEIISEIGVLYEEGYSILIDNEGNLINTGEYFRFYDIHEGLIIGEHYGRFGVINTKGEVLIPFKFNYISYYYGDFYVFENNKWLRVEF